MFLRFVLKLQELQGGLHELQHEFPEEAQSELPEFLVEVLEVAEFSCEAPGRQCRRTNGEVGSKWKHMTPS